MPDDTIIGATSFEYTLASNVSPILGYLYWVMYCQVWARAKVPARLASESVAGRSKVTKVQTAKNDLTTKNDFLAISFYLLK